MHETHQYSLHPTIDHLATILHQSKLFKHPSQNYTDHTKKPPNVDIAGDFNLPDIDWDSQQTTNTRTASKHNKLLEVINEFGL